MMSSWVCGLKTVTKIITNLYIQRSMEVLTDLTISL